MASSSPPPASAISPSSSASSSSSSPPSPSSSLSPLPSASQSPNATSAPPASLNSPPPPPPPLPSTSPPTSIPNSPPPTSTLTPPPSQADPPSVSPPPPSIPTLPPLSSPTSSPPPPLVPTLPPPTPTTPSPPPPSVPTLPPPTPTTSSPPPLSVPTLPSPTPTTSSPPPPLVPTLPPPTPTTSSPPPSSVPTLPPRAPPTSSLPPPLTPALPPPTPPTSSPSPPSPPLPMPPTPPVATPPAPSPPSPFSASPPPSRSETPPKNPSTPPPNNQPPSVPFPSSPPNNSSSGTPIITNPPPLTPFNAPPGSPSIPISPNGNKSSTLDPNVTAGIGNVNTSSGGGTKNGVVLPVAIVTSILVLSLLGLAVWYLRKKKRRITGYGAGFVMPSPLTSSQISESSHPWSPATLLVYNSSGGHGVINSPPDDAGGLGNSKSWFSYEDLYKVTNGFSENNLLGEGGFGCVYKGCLPDGREVAVKQLKVGGSQGEREFRAEVEIIGRVHHRHLVSLVGYCIADNQRLLVYDYVPNNTLHYHLHERPVLDWAIRVKVAAGAARGIAYLHEDCHPRIIHRDIKSSNILLDNSYEAQVSDFGLAKLALDAVTHVTTRVMGTFGYMAPEYASSGKLTERSDVYSFGVVLLELITGRKPVDTSQPLGDESLVEWARPLLTQALETGDFDSLTDPRLEKNYNEREIFRMIETAAACIRRSAPMRPRMGLVVRALDGLADVDLNNGLKPGQSELFSLQSAEINLFHKMAFGSQDGSSDFSNFSKTSKSSLRDS